MADITLIFEEQPISLALTTATPINLVLDGGATYTAGTGISITGAVIANTAPNVVQELSISGQDLTLSGGGGTVAIPGASLSGTTGQIPYFNSTTTITTENGTGTNNLTWDATNNRLGVGTASPSHRVHISGVGQAFKFNNAAADGFTVSQIDALSWAWSGLSGGMFFNLENSDFILPPGQGNIGIGTDYSTTPTAKLDVVGAQGYSQLRLRTSYTPTSTADALGNTGSVAWDTNYFYIKTSAGWKRSALTTF